jgi:hypothetical protein
MGKTKMSKIYEVRSTSRSHSKTHYWGVRNSQEEAEVLLKDKTTGGNEGWANKYHAGWWIEEIDTTGMFEIPSSPSPRERFKTTVTTVAGPNGTWNTLRVDVSDLAGRVIASFDRNYPDLYRTFEPFRQASRMFALVSPDYTSTSVMDLETGELIATETPSAEGFCPIGYYVPDWWDLNDGSILPGSGNWSDDLEQPRGDFGFVWGCYWGDDSSWKVQYLDLSQVQSGRIVRDERFGYVELATNPKLDPQDFIRCFLRGGRRNVTFSVLASFDLDNGKRETHELE